MQSKSDTLNLGGNLEINTSNFLPTKKLHTQQGCTPYWKKITPLFWLKGLYFQSQCWFSPRCRGYLYRMSWQWKEKVRGKIKKCNNLKHWNMKFVSKRWTSKSFYRMLTCSRWLKVTLAFDRLANPTTTRPWFLATMTPSLYRCIRKEWAKIWGTEWETSNSRAMFWKMFTLQLFFFFLKLWSRSSACARFPWQKYQFMI